MNELESIRRRPDGSIDIDHYIRTSRVQRSIVVRDVTRAAMRSARRLLRGVAAFITLRTYKDAEAQR